MGKRVFVGNLSYETTNDSLREAFAAQKLTVVDAHVVLDRDTGRSRGFGFVEFGAAEEAEKAVSEFDGVQVDGRAVRISEARDRAPGGGGGGFRGPSPGDRPARPAPSRDGAPPRSFNAPPRTPRFDEGPPPPQEGDDRPRRRERPRPAGQDESKRPRGRKMAPGSGSERKKQPRYRDVDDWEDDEELY